MKSDSVLMLYNTLAEGGHIIARPRNRPKRKGWSCCVNISIIINKTEKCLFSCIGPFGAPLWHLAGMSSLRYGKINKCLTSFFFSSFFLPSCESAAGRAPCGVVLPASRSSSAEIKLCSRHFNSA